MSLTPGQRAVQLVVMGLYATISGLAIPHLDDSRWWWQPLYWLLASVCLYQLAGCEPLWNGQALGIGQRRPGAKRPSTDPGPVPPGRRDAWLDDPHADPTLPRWQRRLQAARQWARLHRAVVAGGPVPVHRPDGWSDPGSLPPPGPSNEVRRG